MLISSSSVFADETENLQASAAILPNPSHLLLDFEALNNASEISQETIIEYKITYGTKIPYNQNLSIEAYWEDGEVEGGISYALEALGYIANSATIGHNNTNPTVDLVNRKINWQINSFPANTSDKTVAFKLKATSNYKGDKKVTLPVKARLVIDGITSTPFKNANKTYKYKAPVTTPTPAATSSFSFKNIEIREIDASSANIFVSTSIPSSIRINYGESQSLLNRSKTSRSAISHLISLSDLSENAGYFFRVLATDLSGKTISSDIFSFKSGLKTELPLLDSKSLIVSANNNLLLGPGILEDSQTGSKSAVIIIPQKTDYRFSFSLQKYTDVKRIRAIVRSKQVLGINSTSPSDNLQLTELIELKPGLYSGVISSLLPTGLYEVYIRMEDFTGNITEQKITELKIVKPFGVFSAFTHEPIEKAKVTLFFYNPRSRQYIYIPSGAVPIQNPTYSKTDGTLDLALASGKYRAEITLTGYKEKTVNFTIGQGPGQDYPQVFLEPENFNLITYIKYHWNTLSDFFYTSKAYIQSLSESIRFFELNALVAATILVIMTLLSLSARIRVPLHSLIEYFLHLARIKTVQRKLANKIKGRVFDEDEGRGLANAEVFLIDANKNRVVSHTLTNKLGDFIFEKLTNLTYKIEVMKNNYEPVIFNESEIQASDLGGYLLSIRKHKKGVSIGEEIKILSEKLLSVFFETLLVASFAFELSIGFSLGWAKALPFFTFSVISLILWLDHLSHLRSERNIF